MKYKTYKAGEVVEIGPSGTNYKFMCCDCSLIHRIKFKIKNGQISWQVWRDNRATAAARRYNKRRK